MQVSTRTRPAPTTSAVTPIAISTASAVRRMPPAGSATGTASTICSAMAVAAGSGQGADVFLKQPPGLLAHLLLDLGVEAGFAQRVLKGLQLGRVEGQPALFHFVDLSLVHDLPVGTLRQRRL